MKTNELLTLKVSIKKWEKVLSEVIYCLYDEHNDCAEKLNKVLSEMENKTIVMK